ncbi:unnamed protein product [Rangifer tarandus platyrhynchus]|uniref:Uncharacterized protein n=1 Tax=Rangifer tarandus platyrhynchus TaxID=3082113 RepID=A0AC59YWA7_RANTA
MEAEVVVLPGLSPALSSPGFLPRLWVCCQENSEDEASGRPEADGDCGVLASPPPSPAERSQAHGSHGPAGALCAGDSPGDPPGASAGELPSPWVPAHHPETWVQITLLLSVWVK